MPLSKLWELRMSDDESTHAGERDPAAELGALLTAAVDGIVTIDDRGDVLGFNPAAERMFQYEQEEIRGKPVNLLMPEPYRREHSGYLLRYLETGEPKIIGRGRAVEGCRRDGSTFPIWLSVGEAKTANGRRFVGIIRDLTAQRVAEQRQRSLEERLAQVDRFSLMGEMAAGIAHEINQPLSAIANYAQAGRRLLERGDVDVNLLKQSCEKISDQAHRAGAVIQNLRGFIRKQDISKESIGINAMIRDVLGLIEADANSASIDVRLELENDLPDVMANPIQMQQVILNLTHNAVDAMRESLHLRRRIVIRSELADEDTIRILVKDRGPGVSRSLREGIFHPFVTTKRDGLGVGLAISRTIVEAHGGRLSYRANPEGGAIFVVALPVNRGEEQ